MTEENKNPYISIWLLLITFLVVMMIIIGGLTRLTDSGLSITKWDLFSGILPPLNTKDWENYFSLYKQIPEYKLLNFSMTLEEFKVIYWWEFSHRLLGRIVGILYIIPLVYFTISKTISRKSLISLYFIFFLILLQGTIGWYMVKSGLTENTDVSHYRLSLHLTLAFIIFIMLLWNYLENKKNFIEVNYKKIPYKLPLFFLILILIQITLGALVSGLDAGKLYQTWPMMNGKYFPDDSNFNDLLSSEILSIPSIVQFLHRNIAYFIFLFFLFIATIVFKDHDLSYFRKNIIIIFLVLLLQILLGIFTVLSGAEIIISSLHQIGSIILVTTVLILVYKNNKIN